MTLAATDSHVFVAQGDLLNLACDAWMLPTDKNLSLSDHWVNSRGVPDSVTVEDQAAFEKEECLASRVNDEPRAGETERPIAVATAVPFSGVLDWRTQKASEGALSHIRQAVQEFVRVGAHAVREDRTIAKQAAGERVLLGMPSFATDAGGGGSVRGEVLATLLTSAQDAGAEYAVDIALVLRDARTYAHAQRIRSETLIDQPLLDDEARRVAKLVGLGQLVPFLGAGVSVSAGAPSWAGLLQKLADDIEFTDGDKVALANFSALDQASILRARFGEMGKDFTAAVAQAVSCDRYGLAPVLLANLRTEQAVTLNYDDLFERASEDCGIRRLVIPGNAAGDSTGSWLLKLHGTTKEPESIVLTRDDYLGYNATRNALSAIVKANLITRHLLFVGFGLADDHFHEIIHDVRRAVPDKSRVRATALMLKPRPFERDLWGDQLQFVYMADAEASNETAARALEIFLDMVAMYASEGHPYLLDESFESSLSDDERALKRKLIELTDVGPDVRALPAWNVVESLLNGLGLGDQRTSSA